MIKTAEATGKSYEAAIAAARAELGIGEDEGSVELLAQPKRGFLGVFGSAPARVRVTVELPDPKPQKSGRDHGRKKAAPKAARTPAPKSSQPKPSYDAGSREEQVDSFLRGLLERMGVEADILISKREGGGLNVELCGANMGAVIGRRGETLDAIQHLVNYALNRGGEKHMHICVDAENYRSKREESLVHLAEKMAAKALKYKRSMALEPMNSYERHVIHTALQNYEGVTTSSIGTEPNRRVVVSCVGGEQPRERSNGRSRSRGERKPKAPKAAETAAPVEEAPVVEEVKAPVVETLPPDFPEGYEPPVKNKPTSREWC
ncbi:MAG: protein jag [Oscillospiraceae bacterium]|nr:protein jag [Oscillospiraceae bacterium]